MLTAHATFETENGSRYLQQLCKHFSHKREVAFDPTSGRIELPPGPALLEADDRGLKMKVEAEDQESLDRLKSIVENHLVRFAFREKLESLDWQA